MKKKIVVIGFIVILIVLAILLFNKFQQKNIDPHYTVCFTPGQNCTQLIVNHINRANQTIRLQAYSFTSKPIVKALERAEMRGVNIFVLLDKSNLQQRHSVVNRLIQNHIPFLIDYKPAIAHNKIIILDNQTTITGSFNFSKSAQYRNAENILIVQNAKIAKIYVENFNRRKADSMGVKEYCRGGNRCKLLLAS